MSRAHIVQAMWGRSPKDGHPVANLTLMSLVHVNFHQVVDPVQADGVDCIVILVVYEVMDAEVHPAIGGGVDRRHHLVACQHGRQIGWGSLHPALPSMMFAIDAAAKQGMDCSLSFSIDKPSFPGRPLILIVLDFGAHITAGYPRSLRPYCFKMGNVLNKSVEEAI